MGLPSARSRASSGKPDDDACFEETARKGEARRFREARGGRGGAGPAGDGELLATITRRARREAIEKAQDVIYDAWERATARSRIALARKALAISPLCADAYSILAEEARSVEEARELYARGVEAGELALGRKGFKEYAGHFWGFLETRDPICGQRPVWPALS